MRSLPALLYKEYTCFAVWGFYLFCCMRSLSECGLSSLASPSMLRYSSDFLFRKCSLENKNKLVIQNENTFETTVTLLVTNYKNGFPSLQSQKLTQQELERAVHQYHPQGGPASHFLRQKLLGTHPSPSRVPPQHWTQTGPGDRGGTPTSSKSRKILQGTVWGEGWRCRPERGAMKTPKK